jgi:hypothetical protein
MKIYTISRGWNVVQNINVQAETDEEALQKAREADQTEWETCDPDDDEDTFFQIENIRESIV